MQLSKKSYLAGAQCHRRLWWQLHDPAAYELRETPAVRHLLREGSRVGAYARTFFPDGLLIERADHWDTAAVLAASRAAVDDSSIPAIFEAAFNAHDTTVYTDVLERQADGSFSLIEVKMTGSMSETRHIPDIAIQAYVLGMAGVIVSRCEIMHLNVATCRHPDLSNLFVRVDVTDAVDTLLASIGAELDAMHVVAAAAAPPEVATGDHCSRPEECPFLARCWPPLPDHHVSTLYRISAKRTAEYQASGWNTVGDLPESVKLSAIAARQRRAVRQGAIVVERDALVGALAMLQRPVAHIDFETISPAIPVWPGCGPFSQIVVQSSCYFIRLDGHAEHRAWLFDGDGDPRRPAAEAVIAACAGAVTVTAWYSSFEQRCIELLAEACPDLGAALGEVLAKLVDLLPVVRENVYHPQFAGSFSLKKVLPALVDNLSYDGLAIAEGGTATAELARLFLYPHEVDADEREQLRLDLLAYCERDTQAMVALTDRLHALAELPAS
jgi:hypothetical protein